jgi:hypothetical protein
MRKILFYSFIIFSYNILLLVLPLLLFLVSLSFANPALLNILPWIYCPFVLLSPLLTISLGYLLVYNKLNFLSWPIPIIISLIGYSPFLGLYRSLSSSGNPMDYLLLIGLPVILGLLVDLTALFAHWFRQLMKPVKTY